MGELLFLIRYDWFCVAPCHRQQRLEVALCAINSLSTEHLNIIKDYTENIRKGVAYGLDSCSSVSKSGTFDIAAPPSRRAGRILEGADSGSQHQKGSGGITPEKFWKTYKRFGALYYICCIKIINLVNVKVLLFSLNLFEKKYFQL